MRSLRPLFLVTARAAVVLGCAVALPMLVGGIHVWLKLRALEATDLPPAAPTVPAAPIHDPDRPTAVVLFSRRATEVTDALPPFALLSATEAMNVYAVAPERTPVPLYNASQRAAGVWVIPHLGFAEYDDLVGRAPDVVVIPYFPGWAPGTDDEVIHWIREHAGPTTRVVTVCAGTETLAATGLLDGHQATSNPYWINRLRDRHPEVEWRTGVRYVADRRMFTSAALASGMDATLAVIADVLGRHAADSVARRVAYPHTRFLDDPRFEGMRLNWAPFPDMVFARQGPPVPVVVADGADEFGLAAALEVEGAPFRRTRVVSVGGSARTARGLDIVTFEMESIAQARRAVWVAGSDPSSPPGEVTAWAAARGARLAAPLRSGLFPFDAVVAEVGERGGALLALATSMNLAYPHQAAPLGESGWPPGWRWMMLWATAGGVGGVATLAAFGRRRRRVSGP